MAIFKADRLTQQNLSHTIFQHQPKILHLFLNGAYNKSEKQYKLNFEHQSTGFSEQITLKQLKKLFTQPQIKLPQLIVINALHSYEIADFFIKSGVKYVLTIQTILQNADFIIESFLLEFYKQIFQGQSINYAYNFALTKIKDENIQCFTCCCAHPHSDNCQWKKTHQFCHFKHSPTCLCEKRNQLIHQWSYKDGKQQRCKWSEQFIETMNLMDKSEPFTNLKQNYRENNYINFYNYYADKNQNELNLQKLQSQNFQSNSDSEESDCSQIAQIDFDDNNYENEEQNQQNNFNNDQINNNDIQNKYLHQLNNQNNSNNNFDQCQYQYPDQYLNSNFYQTNHAKKIQIPQPQQKQQQLQNSQQKYPKKQQQEQKKPEQTQNYSFNPTSSQNNSSNINKSTNLSYSNFYNNNKNNSNNNNNNQSIQSQYKNQYNQQQQQKQQQQNVLLTEENYIQQKQSNLDFKQSFYNEEVENYQNINEITVCCCPDLLQKSDILHGPELKFQLLSKENIKNKGYLKIFNEELPQGEVIDISTKQQSYKNQLFQPHDITELIGLIAEKKSTYQFLNQCAEISTNQNQTTEKKTNNILLIYSVKGGGKTTLAKYLAQNFYQRHDFEGIINIKCQNKTQQIIRKLQDFSYQKQEKITIQQNNPKNNSPQNQQLSYPEAEENQTQNLNLSFNPNQNHNLNQNSNSNSNKNQNNQNLNYNINQNLNEFETQTNQNLEKNQPFQIQSLQNPQITPQKLYLSYPVKNSEIKNKNSTHQKKNGASNFSYATDSYQIEIRKILKNLNIILILDDIDDLLKNDMQNFINLLKELESTNKSIIILTSSVQNQNALNHRFPNIFKQELRTLHLNNAIKLFMKNIENQQLYQLFRGQYNKIVSNLMEVIKRTPSEIIRYANMIKSTNTLKKITIQQQNQFISKNTFDDKICQLKSSDPESFELLILISFFTQGLSFFDIQTLLKIAEKILQNHQNKPQEEENDYNNDIQKELITEKQNKKPEFEINSSQDQQNPCFSQNKIPFHLFQKKNSLSQKLYILTRQKQKEPNNNIEEDSNKDLSIEEGTSLFLKIKSITCQKTNQKIKIFQANFPEEIARKYPNETARLQTFCLYYIAMCCKYFLLKQLDQKPQIESQFISKCGLFTLKVQESCEQYKVLLEKYYIPNEQLENLFSRFQIIDIFQQVHQQTILDLLTNNGFIQNIINSNRKCELPAEKYKIFILNFQILQILCEFIPNLVFIIQNKKQIALELCNQAITIIDTIHEEDEQQQQQQQQQQSPDQSEIQKMMYYTMKIKLNLLTSHIHFQLAFQNDSQIRQQEENFQHLISATKNVQQTLLLLENEKNPCAPFIHTLAKIELFYLLGQIVSQNQLKKKTAYPYPLNLEDAKNYLKYLNTDIYATKKNYFYQGLEIFAQKKDFLQKYVQININPYLQKFQIEISKIILHSPNKFNDQQLIDIYNQLKKTIVLTENNNNYNNNNFNNNFNKNNNYNNEEFKQLEIQCKLQIFQLSQEILKRPDLEFNFKDFINLKIQYLDPLESYCRKTKKYEVEFTRIKNLVSQSIYKQYKQEVFHFICCSPLVEEAPDGTIYAIKQTIIKTTSFYFLNVEKIIQNSQKMVVNKFDTLQKTVFYKILNDGCSFLNLRFHIESEQNFLFQNEDYKLQKEKLTDIYQFFTQNPNKLSNIKIILLGTFKPVYGQFFLNLFQQVQKIQKEISKNDQNQQIVKIPFIVTFNFKSQDKLDRSVAIHKFISAKMDYIKYLSVEIFSLIFLQNLLENEEEKFNFQQLKSIFQKSSIQMKFQVIKMYHLFKHEESQNQNFKDLSHNEIQEIEKEYSNLLGQGPVLINQDPFEHNIIELSPYGQKIDISKLQAPTNIQKGYLTFQYIGQNKAFYQSLQYLQKYQSLNIIGEPGIGKTEFVMYLGYKLRNHFLDGIFYFSLKELQIDYYQKNLIKLMEKSLGKEFQNNLQQFFTSNMLIIFDDFDQYLQGEEIEHLTEVIKAIIHQQTSTIFVTEKPVNDKIVEFEQKIKQITEEDSPISETDMEKYKEFIGNHFSVSERTRMEYQLEFQKLFKISHQELPQAQTHINQNQIQNQNFKNSQKNSFNFENQLQQYQQQQLQQYQQQQQQQKQQQQKQQSQSQKILKVQQQKLQPLEEPEFLLLCNSFIDIHFIQKSPQEKLRFSQEIHNKYQTAKGNMKILLQLFFKYFDSDFYDIQKIQQSSNCVLPQFQSSLSLFEENPSSSKQLNQQETSEKIITQSPLKQQKTNNIFQKIENSQINQNLYSLLLQLDSIYLYRKYWPDMHYKHFQYQKHKINLLQKQQQQKPQSQKKILNKNYSLKDLNETSEFKLNLKKNLSFQSLNIKTEKSKSNINSQTQLDSISVENSHNNLYYYKQNQTNYENSEKNSQNFANQIQKDDKFLQNSQNKTNQSSSSQQQQQYQQQQNDVYNFENLSRNFTEQNQKFSQKKQKNNNNINENNINIKDPNSKYTTINQEKDNINSEIQIENQVNFDSNQNLEDNEPILVEEEPYYSSNDSSQNNDN
ncbi:P-loop containing nucleoside triphosphate hydrolase [Pseudocohnilembus persalinus]|uniref:p-loop containing nucleoside triphosphate hydrolase n=1 Tax=Pseudocohnilembus persalinus TaxID=266149 RepID=A0A0V0QLI0_PSEPJ|nr:P-loop containing nucleoside triphosphate hydrolase [Pseudocohnilembus persalinus]|eukprot:KRX03167.1 P-loop containing nucleoside triphosphate hydrolase [Pseudocohnilembus persalinus]